MKKERKIPRSRVLYSYLISYVGVVLIAFALLSVLLARQVSENMREENLRVTKDKLFTAAEDIQTQVEAMQGIAHQIASIPEFRTVNFEQSKYNETEMVQRLTQFRSFSALSNYFFLTYQNKDNIYTSDGTTLPMQLYGETKIDEEYRSDTLLEIEKLSEGSEKSYVLLPISSSTVLMVCPLKKYAVSGLGLNGCLCLEMRQEDVENRVKQMTGILNGEVEVYYQDLLIAKSEDTAEESSMTLEGFSVSENVRIVFHQNEDSDIIWTNVFSNGGIPILIGMMLVLLGISVFMAWKNYVPIHKLMKKYETVNESRMEDELEGIGVLIDTLKEKDEKNSQRLQEQYTVLREQMLRLISSGGYFEEMNQRMEVLNIRLPGPVFGKIVCTFSSDKEETMIQEMEDLANEESYIYVYCENAKMYTILLSVEEEYQIQELCDALHALFEARGIEADISIWNVAHDLKELHGRFSQKERLKYSVDRKLEGEENVFDEIEKMEENGATESDLSEQKESVAKQNRKAKQAVQYINQNFLKYDLSLDSIAQELHVTSTYLCRLIKQQTGISYKEYLTKLRMEEAKRLLSDPDAAIADVCQKVGYTNVSHFIKIFQKYEGTTPAKYRDQE